MYRVFSRGSILTPWVLHEHIYDNPVDDEFQLEVEDDPIVRVKSIFLEDEHGELSPQLVSIINSSLLGLFSGLAIGGVRLAMPSVQKFIDENQASKFHSHIDAKRQLQHRFVSKFMEGGLEWAKKLGLFAFVFSTTTNISTAYNGKTSVVDYTIGGVVTGLVFKATLGLRAAMVGGLVGGVLGTVAGTVSVGWCYICGITLYESHMKQYYFFKERKKCVNAIPPELEENGVKTAYKINQEIRLKETQLTQGKLDATKQA